MIPIDYCESYILAFQNPQVCLNFQSNILAKSGTQTRSIVPIVTKQAQKSYAALADRALNCSSIQAINSLNNNNEGVPFPYSGPGTPSKSVRYQNDSGNSFCISHSTGICHLYEKLVFAVFFTALWALHLWSFSPFRNTCRWSFIISFVIRTFQKLQTLMYISEFSYVQCLS